MQFRRTERFKRAFRVLPASIQQKAIKALRLLAENPNHPSFLQVKKIQGTENLWEGRVIHKYRFTFQFEKENDQTIVVLRNIDNHDECLKKP